MSILIYSERNNSLRTRLREIIEERFNGRRIESLTGITELLERFSRVPRNVDGALLLISDQKELDDMLAIKENIFDFAVIVIPPDENPETVSKVHRLRPRYVAFPDCHFPDLLLVLERIIERSERWRRLWQRSREEDRFGN